MADPERGHPDIVASAMEYLINIYKAQDKIGPTEIEEAVVWKKRTHPDCLNAERAERLRADLRLFTDHYWATLTDPKNRGRRAEIIRGALR